MQQFPKTQRKLREAKFFLRHLTAEEKKPNSDPEVFRHYLSAFLSASRSITFFLQKENKPLYDSIFQGWKDDLQMPDQTLLENMNEQRVAEVHQGGVELESQLQPASYVDVEIGSDRDPRYGVHFFGPAGVTGGDIKIMLVERSFKFDGGPQEVTTTCKRYLGLLETLVDELEQRSVH